MGKYIRGQVIGLIVVAIVAVGVGGLVYWLLKRVVDQAETSGTALADIAKGLAGVGTVTQLNGDGEVRVTNTGTGTTGTVDASLWTTHGPEMEELLTLLPGGGGGDPTDALYPSPTILDSSRRAAILGDVDAGVPWAAWDDPAPPQVG